MPTIVKRVSVIANSILAVVGRLMPSSTTSGTTSSTFYYPGPAVPRRTPSPADSLRDSGQFTSVSVVDGTVTEKKSAAVPQLRIGHGND